MIEEKPITFREPTPEEREEVLQAFKNSNGNSALLDSFYQTAYGKKVLADIDTISFPCCKEYLCIEAIQKVVCQR